MGPGGYTLVRLSPPDRTHEYLVPDGQYLVGRDAIATDDLRVSRTQLAVGCGSDLVIRDAQAKNPTTLDGAVPSRTTPARQGQRIACAGHEFEIRCRSGSPTT